MRTVLFLLLFTCSAYAQEAAIVHINAGFNESNDWYGLKSLDGVKVYGGYVDHQPDIQKKYNITKVPTLILFHKGQEVERWEGGLDMKLKVTTKEVQEAIDRL